MQDMPAGKVTRFPQASRFIFTPPCRLLVLLLRQPSGHPDNPPNAASLLCVVSDTAHGYLYQTCPWRQVETMELIDRIVP